MCANHGFPKRIDDMIKKIKKKGSQQEDYLYT